MMKNLPTPSKHALHALDLKDDPIFCNSDPINVTF